MVKGNLTAITGNTNQFKEGVRNLRDNLSTLIEYNILTAKLQKAKYDALRLEGFNEQHALELCK